MNTPRTQMVSPRPQLAINTQSTRNQRNQRNQRAPKWRVLDRCSMDWPLLKHLWGRGRRAEHPQAGRQLDGRAVDGAVLSTLKPIARRHWSGCNAWLSVLWISTCEIVAISAHQRPSKAIRGHQRSSAAIRYHEWPSKVISGHQWPSVAISGHQWPSVAISGNQWHSPATSNTRAARRRRCGPIPAPHTPSPSPRSGPWPVPRRARRAGCPRRRAPPRCSSASADLWQRRQAQYTGRAGWCARPSRSSCASPFCGACVRRLPRGQRVQSDTIRRHQTPLGAIRRHQASSGVIRRTHLPRAQIRST